jgi:hypothetical protein
LRKGFVVERSDGKRPLGRHRSRWENNIKIDSKEMEWKVIGYIALALDSDRWRAHVNALMKFGFHKFRRIS